MVAAQDKISEFPPHLKLFLASLILVVMLLMSYQSIYCLYHISCGVARLLSGLRVLFFSVPEIVNSDKNVIVHDTLSKVVEDLKLKHDSDFEKLTEDFSKLQIRNYEIEKEKIDLLEKMAKVNFDPLQGNDGDFGIDDVNGKLIILEIQYEKLNSILQQLIVDNKKASEVVDLSTIKEKVERLSSEFLMWKTSNESAGTGDRVKLDKHITELIKDVDQIKETIGSSNGVSKNSLVLEDYLSEVQDKFPVLSTIGEKLENFETRTKLLEEKLKTDVGLIIEKQSAYLTENIQTKVLSQVETLLQNRSTSNKDEEDKNVVDWANDHLGTMISPTPDTKNHPGASTSSLRLFGLTIWRQRTLPEVIIQRPHSGECWPFSGTSGSLIFKLPRPILLNKIVTLHSPMLSSPRDISVWDHDR